MISVVIPAHNEEGAIGSTIERLKEVLSRAGLRDSEVIVVNDGSTDGTGIIAKDLGVKVIEHLYKSGYGRALKSGILKARHDTIVICDSDGTYPIEAIPQLLTQYNLGYDMVVGRRMGRYYDESWLKRPLRWLLKFIVEFTAGQRIPDINSGFRVFSRSSVIPYFNQLCNTFSFTTSLTLAYLLTGRYISYIVIQYNQRVGEPKVRLFKDSLRTLQYIVQAVLYYNPLKIFLLSSMLTIVFAGMCFALALATKLTSAFFLGVGSLLVAIIVFSLGLLSDQLRQILIALGVSGARGSERSRSLESIRQSRVIMPGGERATAIREKVENLS